MIAIFDGDIKKFAQLKLRHHLVNILAQDHQVVVLREHSNYGASGGPDSIFSDTERTKLRNNELRTDGLVTLFALFRLMHRNELKWCE